MKSTKRSVRRHHRERLLKKRYNQIKESYWHGDKDSEEFFELEARRRIHTPCVCSCWMCGNPRHNAAGKDYFTLQEYKNLLSFKEQIEEI